jgi:hypothetical protein
MSWPCRTEITETAYPCGFDPARCPLAERPRCEIETDPESRLIRHFEQPGTAVVFAPTGCGGKMLAARLREAGVEVAEIAWDAGPDPEAAEGLAMRMAFARARGERIAVFAPGAGFLRRWAGGDLGLKLILGNARLVMTLGVCDAETGRLFGLRKVEPGTAAVLA